jgi:hypothetical protein
VNLTAPPHKSSDAYPWSDQGTWPLHHRTIGIGIPLGFKDNKVPRPISSSSSPCRSFSILSLSPKDYLTSRGRMSRQKSNACIKRMCSEEHIPYRCFGNRLGFYSFRERDILRIGEFGLDTTRFGSRAGPITRTISSTPRVSDQTSDLLDSFHDPISHDTLLTVIPQTSRSASWLRQSLRSLARR